jgi:hypothetical protein
MATSMMHQRANQAGLAGGVPIEAALMILTILLGEN